MMLGNRSVAYPPEQVLWALGSLCKLHQQPFAAELVARELPSESANGIESWVIIQAGERLGFKVKTVQVTPKRPAHLPLPLMVEIKDGEGGARVDHGDKPRAPNFGINSEEKFATVSGFAERMGYQLVGANYAKRVA